MTNADKKKKTATVVSKRRQEARKQAKTTEERVEEKKVASVPWTEDEDNNIYNYVAIAVRGGTMGVCCGVGVC